MFSVTFYNTTKWLKFKLIWYPIEIRIEILVKSLYKGQTFETPHTSIRKGKYENLFMPVWSIIISNTLFPFIRIILQGHR